jgi:hypothetical protein
MTPLILNLGTKMASAQDHVPVVLPKGKETGYPWNGRLSSGEERCPSPYRE